jgi:hypothetical protein
MLGKTIPKAGNTTRTTGAGSSIAHRVAARPQVRLFSYAQKVARAAVKYVDLRSRRYASW